MTLTATYALCGSQRGIVLGERVWIPLDGPGAPDGQHRRGDVPIEPGELPPPLRRSRRLIARTHEACRCRGAWTVLPDVSADVLRRLLHELRRVEDEARIVGRPPYRHPHADWTGGAGYAVPMPAA